MKRVYAFGLAALAAAAGRSRGGRPAATWPPDPAPTSGNLTRTSGIRRAIGATCLVMLVGMGGVAACSNHPAARAGLGNLDSPSPSPDAASTLSPSPAPPPSGPSATSAVAATAAAPTTTEAGPAIGGATATTSPPVTGGRSPGPSPSSPAPSTTAPTSGSPVSDYAVHLAAVGGVSCRWERTKGTALTDLVEVYFAFTYRGTHSPSPIPFKILDQNADISHSGTVKPGIHVISVQRRPATQIYTLYMTLTISPVGVDQSGSNNAVSLRILVPAGRPPAPGTSLPCHTAPAI